MTRPTSARLARMTVVCACLALLAVAARAQPPERTCALKVFLADWDDVPHPERYSREYFQQLIFGLGEPRVTPEGRPLAGSVREYFRNVSGGASTSRARSPTGCTSLATSPRCRTGSAA